MKWLAVTVVALVACTSHGSKPNLEGSVPCGDAMCTSGQLCVTETTGSQCGVNEDAGIGQYEIIAQYCIDLPADCGGFPSCDCITCGGACFGVFERDVSCGCI
jgi:hypothetical protein